MKRLYIGIGVAALLILTVIAIGYSLPVAHTAQRTVEIEASPADVWATIIDVAAYPSWRDDVEAVKVLPGVEGRQVWRETGDDEIEYTMTVFEPPTRMVSRITSPDLPFGGEWEYEIRPAGTGTRITITERGEVYSPIYRFVSRFILGQTTTMDAYLRALGRKFGKPVEPTAVGDG